MQTQVVFSVIIQSVSDFNDRWPALFDAAQVNVYIYLCYVQVVVFFTSTAVPLYFPLFHADKSRILKDHYVQGKTGPVLPENNVLGLLNKRSCKNEGSAHKKHVARGRNPVS